MPYRADGHGRTIAATWHRRVQALRCPELVAADVALQLVSVDVTTTGQLVAVDLALQAVPAGVALQLVTANLGLQGPGAQVPLTERLRAASLHEHGTVHGSP
jgi:ABC-type Fe2+-enterobactin transport system substrate-binding protein